MVLAFPEEESARELLIYLSWVAPLVVILASILDLSLVVVYQKCFHPWRRIIAGEDFVEKVPFYRRVTSAEQYEMTKKNTPDSVKNGLHLSNL